nr:MAG: hypothetical protein [Wufeng shrew polycipivirus 5]
MNGTRRAGVSLPGTAFRLNTNYGNIVRANDFFGLPGRISNGASSAASFGSTTTRTSTSPLYQETSFNGNQRIVPNAAREIPSSSFSSSSSVPGHYGPLGASANRYNPPSFELRESLGFSSGSVPTSAGKGYFSPMSSRLSPNEFQGALSNKASSSRSAAVSFQRPAVTFGPGASGDFARGITFNGNTTIASLQHAASQKPQTALQQDMSKFWDSQLSTKNSMVASKNIQTVAGGVKVGTSLATSAISGPVAAAAAISQAVGEGINSIQTGQMNTQISKDYARNATQHAPNADLNANLIKSQQENTRNYAAAGGSIGALFGPVGALIGHAIGSSTSNSKIDLNTTSSFGGRINASDSGIAASASTSAPTNQNLQQDNVN